LSVPVVKAKDLGSLPVVVPVVVPVVEPVEPVVVVVPSAGVELPQETAPTKRAPKATTVSDLFLKIVII
jgi:hypothetical protein